MQPPGGDDLCGEGPARPCRRALDRRRRRGGRPVGAGRTAGRGGGPVRRPPVPARSSPVGSSLPVD